MFDLELRRQLSIECDAPINAEEDIKLREDFACRQVRSAARALTTGNKDGKIPATRVAELENILKDYYKTEIISKQLLETAARLDSKYERRIIIFKHFSSRIFLSGFITTTTTLMA